MPSNGVPERRSHGPASRTAATTSLPDATFTLRLSYGTVKGYEENGRKIPYFTDFAGAPSSTPPITTTSRPTSFPTAG